MTPGLLAGRVVVDLQFEEYPEETHKLGKVRVAPDGKIYERLQFIFLAIPGKSAIRVIIHFKKQ